MLNKDQIKLVQTAVRAAGLRDKQFDGRYRMLLGQYLQPNGRPVTSCTQLTNGQLDDLLAICECHGWRMPGKAWNHFQRKIQESETVASFAQQEAIKHLAGDMGWNDAQLAGMLKRMTGGFGSNVSALSPGQAYKIIEALKAMLGRQRGTCYENIQQVKEEMECAKDGKENQI